MNGLSDLKSRIAGLAGKVVPAPAPADRPGPGVRHYLREAGPEKARVHLRTEVDGHALLLVNAARAFHLNPTAALMAYLALEERSEKEAAAVLRRVYHVSADQARSDYTQFLEQFQELIRPDGACPVCDLELEINAPFSDRPSAPYRMDLALTYRCNNNCAHCYNARPRSHPELSTAEWKRMLDRLWQIGVPHVVFTGGEPTLRDDLPELIAHAERNGQITGINTNGRRLKDAAFLDALVAAGLDHVQITLESHEAAIHDGMVLARGAWQDTVAGLRAVLATRLYVMTNTTLLENNCQDLQATLDFLAAEGVPTFGLNALIYSGRGSTVGKGLPEASLPPLLELARAHAAKSGQRLIWYTPTQYCHFDPVLLDLGVKGCSAALYNMCVEPDGGVLPCQSYYQVLGNLLDDPWDSIWNHELSTSLRERRGLPDECQACALIHECGGGCPLARQSDPHSRPSTVHPL